MKSKPEKNNTGPLKGEILLGNLPGRHSPIVHEPHVAGLARRLNEYLDAN